MASWHKILHRLPLVFMIKPRTLSMPDWALSFQRSSLPCPAHAPASSFLCFSISGPFWSSTQVCRLCCPDSLHIYCSFNCNILPQIFACPVPSFRLLRLLSFLQNCQTILELLSLLFLLPGLCFPRSFHCWLHLMVQGPAQISSSLQKGLFATTPLPLHPTCHSSSWH